MSTTARALILFVVGVTLTIGAGVGLAAAAVYRAGSVRVEVADDSGTEFRLRLPAGLTELAFAALPDPVLREVASEIEPWWPALRALPPALAQRPDFTLVEVRGRDGTVRVRKQGGRAVVEVDAEGERVRVEIPLRTLERLAARLG